MDDATDGEGRYPADYDDDGADDEMEEQQPSGVDLLTELPAFANEENVALNARIQALERQIAASRDEASSHRDRQSAMVEHVRAVQLELSHAQSVLEAKKKEATTEEHLAHLAERALGRVQQDIAALDRRADVATAQLAAAQEDIARNNAKLEQLRRERSVKDEALARWTAVNRRVDDDASVVAKYSKEDEAKAASLQRELERLTAAVAERKAELDSLATEASTKRLELDKVASDYALLHAERHELITRWQDALSTVTKRDADIAAAKLRGASTALAVKARRGRLVESREVADKLQRRKEEAQRALVTSEARTADARAAAQRESEKVTSAREKMEGTASEVEAARADRARLIEENARLEQAAVKKEAAVTTARAKVEAAKRRLTETQAAADSAGGSLRSREALLAAETARLAKLEREVERLKDIHVTARQAVADVSAQQDTLALELEGAHRRARNMRDKASELQSRAAAQLEHVYAAEFAIQEAERRISRVRGEVSDEEKRVLTSRKVELQAQLDSATAAEKAVAAQVKEVRGALQAALRTQADLTAKVASAKAKVDEAQLQNGAAVEALRVATRDKEESLVAHDVLKLELRKMRDALSMKSDEVFGLENRAAQLALTVEARKLSIETEAKLQRARAKLLEQERHSLAMDVADRAARVKVLQARYDALRGRVRGSGRGGEGGTDADAMLGADGELVSQASILVKAARKREELRREAEGMDQAIAGAEGEVSALQATLTHMAARNSALREALRSADPGSDEAAAVKLLEAQVRDAQGLIFARKKELGGIQARIDSEGSAVEAYEAQASALALQAQQLRAQIQRERSALTSAQAALDDYRAQLTSARARLRSKRASSARPASGGGNSSSGAGTPTSSPLSSSSSSSSQLQGLTSEEAVCLAHALRESTSGVISSLHALAREFPQLAPALQEGLVRHQLTAVSRQGSRQGGAGVITSAAAGAIRPGSGAAAMALAAIRPQLGSSASMSLQVPSSSARAGSSSSRPPSQRSTHSNNSGGGEGRTGTPQHSVGMLSAGGLVTAGTASTIGGGGTGQGFKLSRSGSIGSVNSGGSGSTRGKAAATAGTPTTASRTGGGGISRASITGSNSKAISSNSTSSAAGLASGLEITGGKPPSAGR